MRTFGFMSNRNAKSNEVQIPSARMARVNQSLKRRLDDDVEEVFNRACATNDLEAANDLLSLLEKWHTRRSAHYGRERRVSGVGLQRARKELERLTQLREANPAATDADAALDGDATPAAI